MSNIKNKNNNKKGWLKKARRTIASILPIDKKRKGKCIGCGECCKLPVRCIFLKNKDDGTSFCSIYLTRPLNCRKYPRTKSESETNKTCGFIFE